MSLKGKVAILTGAGKGIGRSIALSFAQEGMDVVLAARTRSDLDSVAKEVQDRGKAALAVPTDVSDEQQVARLITSTVERFGKIDILVNNAGVGVFKKVVDLRPDDFDRMWEVNVRGAYLCSRAALPYMMKQNSGVIVNVASLAGKNAFVGGAGYAATKWALRGFSQCMMLEVREYNIRSITVCPGSVDTEFGAKIKPRALLPQDVADAVLFAVKLPGRAMASEIDLRPTIP